LGLADRLPASQSQQKLSKTGKKIEPTGRLAAERLSRPRMRSEKGLALGPPAGQCCQCSGKGWPLICPANVQEKGGPLSAPYLGATSVVRLIGRVLQLSPELKVVSVYFIA
jgi:hypothetical protein